jgi:hypothetical protein
MAALDKDGSDEHPPSQDHAADQGRSGALKPPKHHSSSDSNISPHLASSAQVSLQRTYQLAT